MKKFWYWGHTYFGQGVIESNFWRFHTVFDTPGLIFALWWEVVRPILLRSGPPLFLALFTLCGWCRFGALTLRTLEPRPIFQEDWNAKFLVESCCCSDFQFLGRFQPRLESQVWEQCCWPLKITQRLVVAASTSSTSVFVSLSLGCSERPRKVERLHCGQWQWWQPFRHDDHQHEPEPEHDRDRNHHHGRRWWRHQHHRWFRGTIPSTSTSTTKQHHHTSSGAQGQDWGAEWFHFPIRNHNFDNFVGFPTTCYFSLRSWLGWLVAFKMRYPTLFLPFPSWFWHHHYLVGCFMFVVLCWRDATRRDKSIYPFIYAAIHASIYWFYHSLSLYTCICICIYIICICICIGIICICICIYILYCIFILTNEQLSQ